MNTIVLNDGGKVPFRIEASSALLGGTGNIGSSVARLVKEIVAKHFMTVVSSTVQEVVAVVDNMRCEIHIRLYDGRILRQVRKYRSLATRLQEEITLAEQAYDPYLRDKMISAYHSFLARQLDLLVQEEMRIA